MGGGDNPGNFSSSVASTPAVSATGTEGADGIHATSDSGVGINATSNSSYGVNASSRDFIGVHGSSSGGIGVLGESDGPIGVQGMGRETGVIGTGGTGVQGTGSGPDGTGVRAYGSSHGIWVECDSSTFEGVGLVSRFVDQVGTVTGTVALSTFSLAGEFFGDILVHGGVRHSASSSSLIDHPLEPTTKFLSHTSVEAPEMKTLYDGVVVLDANGEAEVEMPVWFEALNTDFRYQLTPLGAPGPNLNIAEKVHDNRFKIAGGSPQMEVCWCVTGIRQDAWAKTHQLPIEQDKPTNEQGYYLHPELYGKSEQKSIMHVHYPKLMENPKK